MKQSLLIFVILCIISVVNCQTASPSSSSSNTRTASTSPSESALLGLTASSSTPSTASASTTASFGQTTTETPSLSASQSALIGALTASSSTTSTASASTTASSGQTTTETPSLSASQSALIGVLTPSSSTTSTTSASTTASSGQTITESPSLSASASSLIGGLTPSSSVSASSTASSGQTITQSSSLSASASAGIINIFSSSPSNTASPTPSVGSGSAIYAVQFAAFESNLIYDYNDLITYLSRTLRVSSITETDPLARKRSLTTTTQVYVSNVTRGSAFESYLVEPSNWVPEFNNISESSVDASQVSVFEDLPTPSTTPTASLFAGLFSSTSSASLSASASPSPAVAYVNIAVSFPDLVTRVINDTDELLEIFSEALNFDISQVSEDNPSPGYRRDVPAQTVYVINANPTQADFVNSREWVPRFNQLADLAVEPQSVTIRQLASTTPSATASIGQTITATPSTTPSFLANTSASTRPNYAESATCLFEFPYNTTAPYCIDSAQTLFLPWFGPVSSSELPSPDSGSLEVCITVNDPACMSTVPITGKRQQSTAMTSNCSQPFARFWSQWDACQYDFAPYAGNTSFDQSNVDNTCAQNTTTTQISYLGNFFGNWSFVQDPCYASSSNQVNRQQRQQQVNTPQQRCYCVPYPSGSVFGTGGRFYTELTVYQTADSGVPASIKVTCNPYPCQNATGAIGPIYPPVEYVKYYSSNDRALILGIVLGFGLPCLIYCIAAIIIAVLILLLLLLLGNGTNAKTFWVPSRDDL